MLSLITPTRGRPQAFAMLERWMKRQTYRASYQWIVSMDSDPLEYEFTMGQVVVSRKEGDGHSLLENLRAALPKVAGDIIAFIEDDDYYAPDYLKSLVAAFDDPSVQVAGFAPAVYYRVTDQLWRCIGNKENCSLGMSAIRSSVVPAFLSMMERGSPFVDVLLWKAPGLCKKVIDSATPEGLRYHVGMKGMPGTMGIGIGHRPEFPGRPDPTGKHLRDMMGDDALAYREFMGVPG